MIALLTGKLAYRSPEQIIVDVAGVGYRLQIPLSTFYALPEEGNVQLQVHTHVKEDAIYLFGFSSRVEKDLFVLLISVSGVGPKLAITTLSHIAPEELALALSEGDIPRLTAIPGIGKKSAERLILELQDKATAYALNATIPPRDNNKAKPEDDQQDALSALVNLGYKETLAKRALNTLRLPPGSPLEDILKAALQNLMK
ncbi:Holliday junction DNA helicase subunit RuvA [Desulfuromusa kysingii]|uniref:Holliday junction branch migration complex subunit RuvA n=1 Tax=Desulfuromusa kysingii TaxID=37625 RepID=A0A1H3WWJ7_9BACT|nr:Holliday junction branch migration protein RuvA [Desulfuromusa kysingii]SDZ90702.1 Holliday junction DNA helicase subunit RuvA [Desulfuromusa kysingii]